MSLLSLKLSRRTYTELLILASIVRKRLSEASGIYNNPYPSLLILDARIAAYKLWLEKWSDKNTRSRLDMVYLNQEKELLKTVLMQLSKFCENKTPRDIVSLS